MATFTLNPKKYTGAETLVVDALVLKIQGFDLAPELPIPLPDLQAANSLRNRVWAYVRAMENCLNPVQMGKMGYVDAEKEEARSAFAEKTSAARKFTTRVEPHPAEEGKVQLVYFLAMNRPKDAEALNFLSDQIATMSEGKGAE
jgi:hypothetical protein